MKKISVLLGLTILVALLSLFLVMGCTQDAAPDEKDEETPDLPDDPADELDFGEYTADNPLVIRFGSVAVAGSPNINSIEAWGELLAERSDGRIKLEVFHSGELGPNRETFRMLQEGSLDMQEWTTSTITMFDERIDLACLPGLFKDYEEAQNIPDWMLDYIDDVFMDLGVRRLVRGTPLLEGVMAIPSVGRVGSIEDMAGLKMRVVESPMLVDFTERAGIISTPLPYGDVYSALERGVLDGTFLGWTHGIDAGFTEVATELTDLKVMHAPSNWYISEALWQSYPEGVRQIMQETVPEAEAILNQNNMQRIEDNKAKVLAEGATIYEVSEEEQIQFMLEAYAVWDTFIDDIWEPEITAKLREWMSRLD